MNFGHAVIYSIDETMTAGKLRIPYEYAWCFNGDPVNVCKIGGTMLHITLVAIVAANGDRLPPVIVIQTDAKAFTYMYQYTLDKFPGAALKFTKSGFVDAELWWWILSEHIPKHALAFRKKKADGTLKEHQILVISDNPAAHYLKDAAVEKLALMGIDVYALPHNTTNLLQVSA